MISWRHIYKYKVVLNVNKIHEIRANEKRKEICNTR